MHESDPELPTIVSQRYCRLCRKHKVRLVLEPAEVEGLMLGGGVNPSIQKIVEYGQAETGHIAKSPIAWRYRHVNSRNS